MPKGKDKKKELARIIAGRMSGSVQQVDAVRSTRGQIKGLLTHDTLEKLREMLADHERAGEGEDPVLRTSRLACIIGRCDDYIRRHGTESDARAKQKVDTVTTIQQNAMQEWGRRMAEAQYLEDSRKKKTQVEAEYDQWAEKAKAKAAQGKEYEDFVSSRLDEQLAGVDLDLAHDQTRNAFRGGTDALSRATQELVQRYGLSEAEVLAVKIYTAQNYKYINAATSNDQARLEEVERRLPKADPKRPRRLPEDENKKRLQGSQPFLESGSDEDESRSEREQELVDLLELPESDARAARLRQLLEEGSLHGAMAIEGLQKLPPVVDLPCFRGMRLTEAKFAELYGSPADPVNPRPVLHLTSVSTDRAKAEQFANGMSCRNPEAVVSVLECVQVQTGRAIGDLSIHANREQEVLLLPGAVLETDLITESADGPLGIEDAPDATKWFVVTAHQV